jgi:rhodanese-related sulfurtransferase
MYKKYNAKKIIHFVVFILLIGVFTGCSNPNVVSNKEDSASFKAVSFSNITPEEAKKRLSNEQGIILLDVRTKEEFDTGHIKDAMLIPVDDLEKDALKNLKDKEAPIFVYCRSGNRSISAANILVELGYKNVYNLGGIRDWPYEVIK